MASIRSIVFFAFAAVAVQSAVAWDFNIPGLFGSSFGLNSIGAGNRVGETIQLENGALTKTVELGPLGGIQAKIVAPVLPNIPDALKMANDNMNKFVNGIGGGLGRLSGFMHNTIDQQIKNFEKALNNMPLNINNMQSNIADLVGNASGLIKKAIEFKMIGINKVREFAASVVQSSVKNAMNAGATLIDLLEKAVKAKLLMEKQAIILIRDAIEAGLHKTEGAVDVAVNQFLDGASQAGRISQDLADKLKALLRDAGSSGDNKVDINANGQTQNGASAGGNAAGNAGGNAGGNAAAGINANANAGAKSAAELQAAAEAAAKNAAELKAAADAAAANAAANAALNGGVNVNA